MAGININSFSVRWTKTEVFSGGQYQFTIRADDGIRIFVDGVSVYNKWLNQKAVTKTQNISIAKGTHTVKVEYYENNGNAEAQVSWKKI